MKALFILLLALPAAAQYHPTSVRDFQKKSDDEQRHYVLHVADMLAPKVAKNYNTTPEAIHDWFSKHKGNELAAGYAMVLAGVGLLNRQEKRGVVDTSKVSIEDVVSWALDEKFVSDFP